MGRESKASFDVRNMGPEDRAALAMWFTGVILLPAGLVVFFGRRLLRRMRALARDTRGTG